VGGETLEKARNCGAFRYRLAAANGDEKYKNKNTSRPWMASKRHEKRNNQPKTSGLDGRGIEWDERTTGGAGGARLDRFGGNRVARVGEIGKIHQFIKLYYFSVDLQN
jgi:hypothetical protein